MQTEMAIFVAPRHPLAAQGRVTRDGAVQLARAAPEHLSGQFGGTGARSGLVGAKLSAAVQHGGSGLGWCILPSALVEEFAGSGSLVALDIAGWPRMISTDLLWNKKRRAKPEAGCVSICRAWAQIGAIYAIVDDLCDFLTFLNNCEIF